MDPRLVRSNSVFFLHLRKCGGTSLRRVVTTLASSVDKELEIVEGWTLDERHPLPNDAYRITSLRHPIERIKSSYRFEGRWPQQAPERNTATALPFGEWVDRILARPPSSRVWECVDNYFVKSLIGYPVAGCSTVDEHDLATAKSVLGRFELILLMSQLSTPTTDRLLSQRFGRATTVPHDRFPTRAESPPEHDDDLFDAATLARLESLNQLDIELYDEAVRLFQQQLPPEADRDRPTSRRLESVGRQIDRIRCLFR